MNYLGENKMNTYRELNIYYDKDLLAGNKFYKIKLVISRVDCDNYHYLDRDKKTQIWFENLRNEKELKQFLKGLDWKFDFQDYERNHVLEMIQPACKFAIETMGVYIEDTYSLQYLIHTILTSFFMDWEEQKIFFEKMIDMADESIKHYKEKEEQTGEKILSPERKK